MGQLIDQQEEWHSLRAPWAHLPFLSFHSADQRLIPTETQSARQVAAEACY